VFIEWGDAIEALLPESYLQIELSLPDEDTSPRRMAVSAQGPRWAGRWDRLADAMLPWKT
jgi:tRNA A37 threonylcarbamoyladenosine biosynthesis protein TsaE